MNYQILETRNYDLFINNEEQRIHKDRHIQVLKKSMQEWGFIPCQQIAVVKAPKGKFLIIDGHSRFDSAKQLGLPILYQVLEGRFAEAVATLNIQKAWNSSDCARRFAIKGLPDYKVLQEYVMKGIPFMRAATLLYGGQGGGTNYTEKLKSGTYTIKSTAICDQLLEVIAQLGDVSPVVKSSRFLDAFSMCAFLPDFDTQRLIEKLKNSPRALVKTATKDQMLDQIEEIYNYRASIKINLAWKARAAAQERNPTKAKKLPGA